ncbi:MAG: class I SAM-dependent methyltransferase, partial [Acidimicrobiales bacterium]
MGSDERLIEFYERGAFYEGGGESARLQAREGRVEFLRTRRILRSKLQPNSDVLDIGGASGGHAAWLVEDAHEVEIVDIVPVHVEEAVAQGFRASLGDARELPHRSESFDAALLLGPLYHLVAPDDRARALSEAVRVTRPGGLVVA